jgi:phosphopantothenoylcysteine synthetase/decarboxylase
MDRRLEELADLISDMDVPSERRELKPEDLRWLSRNLPINNADHPNLDHAMSHIDLLGGRLEG